MAIDLFSLRANLEVTGASQGISALREIDAIGRKTASAMRGMGNDARLATSHFLTGKIGITDYRTALGVASEQATTLGGRLRGMGTVSAGVMRGMSDAVGSLAGKFSGLGGVISKVAGAPLTGLLVGLTAINQIRAASQAYDELTRSQLRLQGAAKLAGMPLTDLQRLTAQVAHQYKMATPQAAELVSVMTRMGVQARDLSQVTPGIHNFLNVAASMGLSFEETITRINQVMRNTSDDGTDALFQKNPSQIWKEYAVGIGKTVAQLTSAERAMAMFSEAAKVAARDPGAYLRFIETVLGKQAAFNAQLFEAQARFGEAIGPLRMFAYAIGTTLANATAAGVTAFRVGLGSLKSIFVDLIPGFVKLGAGHVLSALATLVRVAGGLLSKLGISVGTGLADRLDSTAAGLLAAGRASVARNREQGAQANRAIAEAAGDGKSVDMTPVEFPKVSGNAGTGGDDKAAKKELQAEITLLKELSEVNRLTNGDYTRLAEIEELLTKKLHAKNLKKVDELRLTKELLEVEALLARVRIAQGRSAGALRDATLVGALSSAFSGQISGGERGNSVGGSGGFAGIAGQGAGVLGQAGAVPALLGGRGGASNAGPSPMRSKMREAFQKDLAAMKADVDRGFASLATGSVAMLATSFGNAFKSKHPLREFGKNVLAGFGSIFSQMGKSLISYGAAMMGLLPALSNPFTSGPAALVAGALLLGLGTALGATATGSSSGGGSSAPKDQITRITLTNPGAGGQSAPEARPFNHYTIIGPDDLSAQSQLGKLIQNGSRRGIRYG